MLGPYSESVVKNPTSVGRGFYSSIGLEEVFHVKTLCLLFYLRNYFVSGALQTAIPNRSQECSETIKKVERHNSPASCVLVLLNLSIKFSCREEGLCILPMNFIAYIGFKVASKVQNFPFSH